MSARDSVVLLSAQGIEKTFGTIHALAGVNVTLHAGEIHAMLGPNGAGKSTFIKILDGVYLPDRGKIEVATPIAFIHQDLGLVPDLTIRENLALSNASDESPFGWIVRVRRERQDAHAALAAVSLSLDPETMIRDISLGEQTLVAIARALSRDAGILVLDEATAALTDAESAWLFRHLQSFVSSGGGVLVVTHRLREVAQNCRVTTLFRDGAVEFSGPTPEGSELAGLFSKESPAEEQGRARVVSERQQPSAGKQYAPAVVLRQAKTRSLGPIDLTVPGGQILSVVGHMTSGLYGLGHMLSKRDPLVGGSIKFPNAVSGEAEVGFIPENRWEQGLMAGLDITSNIACGHLLHSKLSRWGWVNRRAEVATAEGMIAAFSITPSDPTIDVRNLSGGNAQKVVVGRAASLEPKVLVLCEPTRGVDVTAQAAIRRFLQRQRDVGTAVVVVTVDIEEALSIADSVAVMTGGRLGPIRSTSSVTHAELLEELS